MKTVEFTLVYQDSITKEVEYAVLFWGFMTRRYLYLMRVSDAEERVNYVKVLKTDTEISTATITLSDPDEIREMYTELGISDERVIRLSDDDANIVVIKRAVKKLNKNTRMNIKK